MFKINDRTANLVPAARVENWAGSLSGLVNTDIVPYIARVVQSFDPQPGQVGAARRFAMDTVGQWGLEHEDVVLVTSELAANAVVHAGTPFTVALILDGHRITIEVADQDPRLPEFAPDSVLAQGGRGLLIVDRLARAWGARPGPVVGKVVWAEFDAQVAPAG